MIKKESTHKTPLQIQALQARYEQCAQSLICIGPICQGSVIKRTDERQSAEKTEIHGPYYLWTRSSRAKL
jgi:hypothetical protein